MPKSRTPESNPDRKGQDTKPVHPGRILFDEFMKPSDISMNRLARDLIVPQSRISKIVNGQYSITADTALRLGKYFDMPPETWMALQADYELFIAKNEIGEELEKRVQKYVATEQRVRRRKRGFGPNSPRGAFTPYVLLNREPQQKKSR